MKDNILGADLADMQLIGKFNKGIRLLLCVIDTFSKHSWVIPLKDKKVITIINASQNIFIRSKKKKKIHTNMRKQRKYILPKVNEIMARKKLIWTCIQHIMKENLLLLNDLLEF